MSRKHFYGFLLLAFSIACKGVSPADKLSAELQTVTSWAATMRMVGETWVSSSVPTTYALKTLERTQQELQQESDALSEASEIPAAERATVLERLKNLQKISGEMLEFVQRGDRASMAQAVGQISVEEEAIRNLARSGGAQP